MSKIEKQRMDKVSDQMLTVEEKIELSKKSAEYFCLLYKKSRDNYHLTKCVKAMMRVTELEDSLILSN